MRYCYCEAKVRSSRVGVVYVVRLRIIFSKVALQKRGSMGPPLDPPLRTSVHLGDVAEHCCGPFHIVHAHSYRYSHGISILLGLGTPLIVPLLCAISPLSSQGAKTHTRNMANSAASGKFHNNCVQTIGKIIHGVIVFVGSFHSGNGR